MNSFSVPAIAGQIYAMAGMETQLNAVVDQPGTYQGLSANYSGAGFSHMNFKMHGLSQDGFNQWVSKVRQQGSPLDLKGYLEIEKPSEAEPVRYFSAVPNDLYSKILNLCPQNGKMCLSETMAIDAHGGGGENSEANRDRLTYDGHRSQEGVEEPGATFPASGRPPNTNVQPEGMKPDALSPKVNQQRTAPDEGQGHNMPGMKMDTPAPAQLHDN
jgi:cytochrome o ubiquinol oxidase subunit II